MKTLLLDTHVVQWWSAEPGRLSDVARDAIELAESLSVASITWFELSWLATNGRIAITVPLRVWLDRLAELVGTVDLDQGIAAAAVALPKSFPGDPADRIIYATAMERGLQVVTKDTRMREHPSPRQIAVW